MAEKQIRFRMEAGMGDMVMEIKKKNGRNNPKPTRRKYIPIGTEFGKWTVRENLFERGFVECVCECKCGTARKMAATELRLGRTGSCGCNGATYSHGRARRGKKTKEYNTWVGMVSRCYNKNGKQYEDYGGRGVKVCDRWIVSFENFLDDMGSRPSQKHSIDRFPDNDGNYEPGNCRWATQKEQNRNTRANFVLEIKGVSKCFVDWCEESGVNNATAYSRWLRGERDPAVIFSKDCLVNKRHRIVEIDGVSDTISGWCRRRSVSTSAVFPRLKRGMTLEQALAVPSKKVFNQ